MEGGEAINNPSKRGEKLHMCIITGSALTTKQLVPSWSKELVL